MSIVKLSKAGESVTWTLTACETVPGKFGSQVKFTNSEGDIMYVASDTAERQLDRCGLTIETAVGETLVFSRDENKKTPGAAPYWSIRVAGGADKEAPKPTARVVPQAVPANDASLAQRRDAILANYLLLWDAVAGHLAQTSQKHGYGLDAAAIQAATATVWISWKDKGIQPDGLRDAQPIEQPPEIKMPAPSGKRLAPPVVPDARPGDDDLPF